ncbi:MAG: DUF2695 domain-containing protein [Anaerolineae bacterium]|nr:DUF2695 domain-containing protein [Anaerolineae bacterium]
MSDTIKQSLGVREICMNDPIPEMPISVSPTPPSEAEVLDAIEQSVRRTTKAYGYQHLSTIGTHLRAQFSVFSPSDYGCKTLLQLIERHPDRFKVKWSAPAHKGRSHVWIRLAGEPKRKEGYSSKPTLPPKLKPRLMTVREFNRLCESLGEWLEAHQCDGSLRKTRQWLRRRDFLSLEGNTKLIKQLGGHCDCEVLMNVIEKWSEV